LSWALDLKGCLSFSSVPGSEFISEQENRAENVAKQARASELIAKGDGYTFIAAVCAALRSPDLRHTEKRTTPVCVFITALPLSKSCLRGGGGRG
jgi:hypothetical protein